MFVLTGFKEKRQGKEAAFSTEEVHFCDIGLLRKSNQDSVFVFQSPGFALFLIADGMGGHLHGEMAAQAVSGAFSDWCDHFCIEKLKENFDQILEEISVVIERINLRIYSEWNQDGICGTTLTLLAFFKNQFAVINVGDSRIYRKKALHFNQITTDDIWENRIEAESGIQMRKGLMKSARGKLTAAVGVKKSIIPGRSTDVVHRKEFFFLCSDGVYKCCDERLFDKVARRLSFSSDKDTLSDCLQDIRDQIYRSGAPDNASGILVKIIRRD